VQSVYSDYLYSGLENYKLLKGIVFDGTQSDSVFIDLSLVAQTTAQLTIEVKISSVGSMGKTTFHYAATLFLTKFLSKDKKALPTFSDALSELRLSKQESGAALYEDGTLFHGKSLQGIQAVNHCSPQGLLLSCKIDSAVLAEQGEFDLHSSNIFANDLIYQAMLVWVRKQLGLGSLPSSTLAWTVYAEVPLDHPFYLSLNVTEQKGSAVSADIALIGADRKIYAQVSGVTVTSSAALNDLFKPVQRHD